MAENVPDTIQLEVSNLDEIVLVGLRYHAMILRDSVLDDVVRPAIHPSVRAKNIDDTLSALSYINETIAYFGGEKVTFE